MTDDSYKLGVKAFEQGQVTEALQHFRDAARLHPNDARVANALGNAWFALNDPVKALKEYTRALRLDPRLAAAHKNLGILEYRQDRFAEAGQELAVATKLSPHDSIAWRFLGLSLAARGMAADAVVPLRRSLQIDPRDAPARLALADAEAKAGERELALAEYRHLLRDASLDVDSQKSVGIGLMSLADAENAIAQFSFILDHSPEDSDLDLMLAKAQTAAHRPDQAIATLQAALSTAKEEKSALYELLGSDYQQTSHPTEAAIAYRNSILADPKRPEPYLRLSWLYSEHHHFSEAEETLREGLRFTSDPYALQLQLGTILLLSGDENRATSILEKAVLAEPHDPIAYTTLIINYTLLDPSYQRPLRTAEIAIKNCPNDYLVHYLYGGLLLRAHRQDFGQPGSQPIVERIKSELTKSIRLNPDFPHSYYDLARTEFETGNYALAEREARAALNADKDFTSARYLLGRVLLKEGRRQEGMADIVQVDQEHREEIQRIETVGQALLAAQAAGIGSRASVSPRTSVAGSTPR